MNTPRTILSGPDFHALGVPGWEYLADGIDTRLATGDFRTGMRLLVEIGEVAEALGHHPDLDLRFSHLDVHLVSHDVGGVTSRDVELAREIHQLAHEAGVELLPRTRQRLELALDTDDFTRIKPFWNAVHGLAADSEPDSDEIRSPDGQTPLLWFQERDHDSGQRFHLDLWVHEQEVDARIAAAVAAGGTLVTADHAPRFWVLADPEGNQMCLCTWQERR